MGLRKEWEHQAKIPEKGGAGTGKIWVRKQTAVDIFEPAANWVAGDLIRGLAFEGEQQTPVMLESEVRDPDSRMAPDQIAGPIDHVERTLRLEIRPPGVLGGTDNIMGPAVMEGITGDDSQVIANTQTAEAIIAVTAGGYTDASTELTLGGASADYPIGSVWALRCGDTTKDAHNQPAVITAVVANASDWDVTFEPSFLNEPIAGTDTVQPGVTWNPVAAYDDVYSVIHEQGFSGDQFRDGVFSRGAITLDRRGLLIIEALYQAIQSYYSAFSYVHGEGGADDLATGDLELDVPDARLFAVGCLVFLEEWNVSTGVMDDSEGVMEITARDIASTPNTITVTTRGSSPIAVTGGSQDLQAESDDSDAIDLSGGISLSSESIVLELDHRGQVTIALTDNGSAVGSDVIADIHSGLAVANRYGRLNDIPFAPTVDYGAGVATVVSDKVHLLSKAYGSQSQVKAVRTTATATTYDKIWTGAATLEYLADAEVQIHPWNPGGTITATAMPNWEGTAAIEGKKYKFDTATLTFDNQVGWSEEERTGDQYSGPHFEETRRAAELTVEGNYYGWVNLLRDLAARDQAVTVGMWAGASLGGTFSMFVLRAKAGAASKTGDAVVKGGYTLMPTDPGLGGYNAALGEVIYGLT